MTRRIFWITLLLALGITGCAKTNTPTPAIEFTLEPTFVVAEAPDDIATPPAYLPQPGDNDLNRANAITSSIYLAFSDSVPAEVLLHISGYLPTPCHELRISVPTPDEDGDLFVEVYSVTKPNQDCEQVLRAYDITINLGSYPTGSYWVWVNGGKIGNFDF